MEKRKFCLTLTKTDMAKQVARLLNSGGQLGFRQRYDSVLSNGIVYFVELELGKIVGVVGLEKKNPDVTEVKHLCVLPSYRGKGLGQKLLLKAAHASETPFIYGMVRESNYVNIHNNLKLGFVPIAKCQGMNEKLIVFARRKDGSENGYRGQR